MLAWGGGLAPLWEHVVRTRRLPPDVDAADVLSALDERLRHPEREIRQHALRVLADVIPALAPDRLERRMQGLLPELLACLGHPAPAVRRAALHTLQAYLARSPDPDRALLHLLTPSDIPAAVGLLLAIPALLCTFRPTDGTLRRVASALGSASNDERLREPAIRSLERVRELFGRRRFSRLSPSLVLETEIRFPEANVTMTVLEDSSDAASDWPGADDDDDCIVKVLSDSSDASSPAWSASRRVRFGGEVVKLRTPDSDSTNLRSDTDTEAKKGPNRSLIPLPVRPAGTVPTPRKPNGRVPPLPNKLLPPPQHRSVEVLHNLSRSPEPSPVDRPPPTPEPKSPERLDKPPREGSPQVPSPPLDNVERSNSSSGSDSLRADPTWETSGFLEKRVLEDMNDRDDWRRRLVGVRALGTALRRPGAVEALEATGQLTALVRWAASLGGRHPRLSAATERVIWNVVDTASETWLRENPAAMAALGVPGAVRLGAALMRRLGPRPILGALLQDAAVARGRSTVRRREAALQLVLVATRNWGTAAMSPISEFASAAAACLDDSSARVRTAALDALAALASLGLPGEVSEASSIALQNRPKRDAMMAAIRARLSRRRLASVSPEGRIAYATGPGGRGADADWVAAALDTNPRQPVGAGQGRNGAEWRRRRRRRKSGIPIPVTGCIKPGVIHKSPISKDSIDSETRQISSGSSDVWSEITPESVPPTPVITEPQPPIEDDVDFRPNTAAEVAFREKLTECRLSRSQADLNDMDLDAARKALSSAPPKQRFSSPEPDPDPQPDPTPPEPKDPPSPTVEKPDEEPKKEPPVIPLGRRSLARGNSTTSSVTSGDCIQRTVSLLESGDWETAVQGLKQLTAVVKKEGRTDGSSLEMQAQAVCSALAKHVRSLRSQVSRQACLAARETLEALGGRSAASDAALEQLAAPLLQRTADTNRFLRADAHAALDTLVKKMGPARVAGIASGAAGARHHSAVVRCSSARLLASLIRRIGPEKFMSLPRDARDRVLKAAAELLTDGSQDTRTHAKDIFSQLAPTADRLHAALADAVPASTMRHIAKTIGALAPPVSAPK